jgi:hypothetical protein
MTSSDECGMHDNSISPIILLVLSYPLIASVGPSLVLSRLPL